MMKINYLVPVCRLVSIYVDRCILEISVENYDDPVEDDDWNDE